MIPTLKFEKRFWAQGLAYVAGIDEVGRGAWAGPVVAGAVILPQVRSRAALRDLVRVRDSKLLSPAQREALCEPICAAALGFATGLATRAEIDAVGIVPATRLAMQRAVEALALAPHALLIDALMLPALDMPQTAIIHGDQLSLSIACASILAKVTRDRLMVELDARLPGYHFAQHKGYGTEQHRAALDALGPCGEHRASFMPIKQRMRDEG
ncbi:MAG: ribonuclease HII [Chloroflexi bacterium]|nr:ribonuclease HII [Chloroflexota bacterium]